MIPRWRRLLEALRLVQPSPETILHRAIRKCGARLERLSSGRVYIIARNGQRLRVEPSRGIEAFLRSSTTAQERARVLEAIREQTE